MRRDVQLEHLELFRAAGRFIGRALLDGQVLPIQLSPVLFKGTSSFGTVVVCMTEPIA